ncbi:hypothetical protein L9F63_017893, partial [Diploptera punctata]
SWLTISPNLCMRFEYSKIVIDVNKVGNFHDYILDLEGSVRIYISSPGTSIPEASILGVVG